MFNKKKLQKENILLSKSPDGFIFGMHNRKYVRKPSNIDGNILVIGDAGSGKTTSIAVPTLLNWKDQVFAIDINGELYKKAGKAKGNENIKVFNPTNCHGYNYDPFYLLDHTDDVINEARKIAMDICPLLPNTQEPFLVQSAQQLLTGFILYYHKLGLNFSETMHQITSQPMQEQVNAIIATEGSQPEKKHISQLSMMDKQILPIVFSELINHITIFTTPDLQRALSSTEACITPADLENGKDIFCCIPEDKIEQWQPLIALIVRQALAYVDQRKNRSHPPILFLFDNFYLLGRMNQVMIDICTMRGINITIAIFVQSINQLEKLYGTENSTIMVDSAFYHIELTNISDIGCYTPVGNFFIKKVQEQ